MELIPLICQFFDVVRTKELLLGLCLSREIVGGQFRLGCRALCLPLLGHLNAVIWQFFLVSTWEWFVFLISLGCTRQIIPDSIVGLQQLKELYLSSNQLETLPDSIGLLTSLKILDVSDNKLNALPESIADCRYYFIIFLFIALS